ncbi:copper homeostasis protein CutC [Paludibacter sp.]|uniref:copper homeostasis protein CutC n=1 Tax=Paludibacter sp. TaxID=1898105 RepID=UPI001353A5C6|nr:copper homeostasis protein CutC [Paludibacter sp.]MTK54621.1 copper homeostasis protein CutC [Paludibacter sp.]
MSYILIETAAFTPKAALVAANNGADRIELCSGFAEGGLSPSVGTIELVRESVSIPFHVLTRPRVGDFVYDNTELLAIEKEIQICKKMGVNGVVIGVLNRDATINTEALKRLIDVARPMSVTFHRAFDQCVDPLQELQRLIGCGVERVLTSGCENSVMEGLPMLQQLVEAAKDKIIILPGGGITPDNAKNIINTLGVKELHLSGKKRVESPMQGLTTLSLCSPGEVKDFSWYECNGENIAAVKKAFE